MAPPSKRAPLPSAHLTKPADMVELRRILPDVAGTLILAGAT